MPEKVRFKTLGRVHRVQSFSAPGTHWVEESQSEWHPFNIKYREPPNWESREVSSIPERNEGLTVLKINMDRMWKISLERTYLKFCSIPEIFGRVSTVISRWVTHIPLPPFTLSMYCNLDADMISLKAT